MKIKVLGVPNTDPTKLYDVECLAMQSVVPKRVYYWIKGDDNRVVEVPESLVQESVDPIPLGARIDPDKIWMKE